MDISRLSLDSARGVHDVQYDADGNAYCGTNTHQWKTGEEWFEHRVTRGGQDGHERYVSFSDRNLGAAVSHRVAVLPNESYIEFWTRVKQAEDKGHIDTIGTSCYSAKDAAILQKEENITPTRDFIDRDAVVGMSYAVDGERIQPHGKRISKEGVAGVSAIVLGVILAIGYLIFVRGK